MRGIRYAGLVAAALALPLCACNETLPDRPKDTATKDRQQVDEIDLSVRLRVVETQIAKLERRVFELQAAPGSVDVDLLRQRLSVTEAALADTARASAEAPVPVTAPTPPDSGRTRKSTAQIDPTRPPATAPSRSSVKSTIVAPPIKAGRSQNLRDDALNGDHTALRRRNVVNKPSARPIRARPDGTIAKAATAAAYVPISATKIPSTPPWGRV